MHNYTPLVISRNDKHKQLTLLSLSKIAFTGRKKNISMAKKYLKNKARRLFRPRYIYINKSTKA
jgi:hypothetical protein